MSEREAKVRNELVWLDPGVIRTAADNVRNDLGDIRGLAETLQRFGMLQPLGVHREGQNYTLVYGHRRREAALLAGLSTVPCLVLEDQPQASAAVQQLLENVQRQQLNDLEQARGFAQLREQVRAELPGASESECLEAAGKLVGLSAATVHRYVSLLLLAPGVQRALGDGSLTVTQAQHLRALADPHKQEEVAAFAISAHLPASQISRICGVLTKQPQLSARAAAELVATQTGVTAIPTVTTPPPHPITASAQASADQDAEAARAEREALAEFSSPERWDGDSAAPIKGSPQTVDRNRVFRIRSVASFCDEVDRLARCLQDGDLERSARGDPSAPERLRLARKQLQFTVHALEDLAKQKGWPTDAS
ncbi:MAG: ParB/RepB/Spo0J family partition protein [Chloroflexi bacterium]|nr:ParB/RepB/Spo0J family partition protein [Chloroflexota bacterium]